MPADVDAMSFPDVVFPAFLFIVGMSIPFGIKARLQRGETSLQIIQHMVTRASALITMGLFMVNAESGFDERKMAMSIATWSMLSYLAFMLLWGVYRFQNPLWNRLGKLTGIVLLVFLAVSYRGDDHSGWMTVQWWGILGLIGWAYLISSLVFQATGNKLTPILFAIIVCTIYYGLSHSRLSTYHPIVAILLSQDAHAAHASIVLSGLACSLIFFDKADDAGIRIRFIKAAGFALLLALSATLLRNYFPISKIYATPSWCLYSSALCVIFFSFLYYCIDLRKAKAWAILFEPAAGNPLICYLIPFMIEAFYGISGLHSPLHQFSSYIGILACILYAAMIIGMVAALNRVNFKMRF